MLFHIRLFLSFTLILIVSVNCTNDFEEEEDAGADDALKQALVLVELLRSEYMKILRENRDLAAAVAMVKTASTSEHTDNTHKPSTLAVNLVVSKSTQVEKDGRVVRLSSAPIPSANTATSSAPPITSNDNFARHYKNLFGSGPSRRFMKQPPGKNQNKMHFRRNMLRNGITTGPLKTKMKKKSTIKNAAVVDKFKTLTTKFQSKSHLIKTQKTTKKRDKDQTKDPLVAQIASEILNEIQGSNPKRMQGLRTKIQEVIEKKKMEKKIRKTSLKIHLGLSSRMPLPLPENNAFCFYVPESPLCGSLKRKRK